MLYSTCSYRFWNHKRHLIKIPFINKGIEFIDLPSIFKDRSVTSSIPAYFQNSEPPILCYKYNKPIRNTVFNFNKLVSDLDIHANTPESWDCKDSKFIYPLLRRYLLISKILNHQYFVINITSPLEIRYLISINLFLILTFMQTLLSHEIVKIPNLFILQPVI